MSDPTELKARIIRLFADVLEVQVPSPETDLIRSGLLDSLKFLDLLFHLEQEFGARIDLNELELDHFRTVEQIVQLVAQKGRSASNAQ